MKYAAILMILLLGLAFGCAQMIQEGKAIDRTKVNQLVVGKTHAEKVVEVLGKPDKVTPVAPGEEQYLYGFYREIPHWWTKNEIVNEKLKVTLKSGVVEKIDFVVQGVTKVSGEK